MPRPCATTITCRPRGPTSCAGWAAGPRRPASTGSPSVSPTTHGNGAFWPRGSHSAKPATPPDRLRRPFVGDIAGSIGPMTIDTDRTRTFVQRAWDADIVPALTEYI